MKHNDTFCLSSDLRNESDVELYWLTPLLRELGYNPSDIQSKTSIKELGIRQSPRGKETSYRPDMMASASTTAKLIIEAKSPDQKLDDWIWQPRAYSLILNSQVKKKNPVSHFLLTNGLETRLYAWDYDQPLYRRTINDLKPGSPAFYELKMIVGSEELGKETAKIEFENNLQFRRPSIEQVNDAFTKCHQVIYKTDNISQSAAFFEFVKIIALKLISDKSVRDTAGDVVDQDTFVVDALPVRFSVAWIDSQSKETANPLSEIWFSSFIRSMEKDIGAGLRKRIFEPDGKIRLSAETIKEVVRILESLYLFGIDADLNGRLFETFLSATMRGKDLGQYFTPRSIVKLGVKIARIQVDIQNPLNTEKVYDGCCGTGGFLIDVLADLWGKVDTSNGYTQEQKTKAKDVIKNDHIWGCEVGKDPNLARIARLNMYLHGDGGATIFNLDGLDRALISTPEDTVDIQNEKVAFRKLDQVNGFFDVVITNPPFAKSYKLDEDGEDRSSDKILRSYSLLNYETRRKELRSNLMFMERYLGLLKPGGRLISVLDDGILSGDKASWFRRWILEHFLLKAVISLPGDAFQRSKARVKTSYIILEKRRSASETQAEVFMYPCVHVGLDDPSRARRMPIDEINRYNAKQEIATVTEMYDEFCRGRGDKRFIVSPEKIMKRFDVKHCLIKKGATSSAWKDAGLLTYRLDEIAEEKSFNSKEVIVCSNHNVEETYLKVTYTGEAVRGDTIFPSDTSYKKMHRVSTGDIAISRIAATYGSVGLVSDETDGCIVSNEYTILVSKGIVSPRVLWLLLRSKVLRSEMLLAATGANRTRVQWDKLKDIEVAVPSEIAAAALDKQVKEAEMKAIAARAEKESAIQAAYDSLLLETDLANTVLSAFKPPQ